MWNEENNTNHSSTAAVCQAFYKSIKIIAINFLVRRVRDEYEPLTYYLWLLKIWC